MSARERILIAPTSVPRLARHIKMRHDAQRDRWILLGPERVFTLDAVAVAVLQLCGGERSVENIATELAHIYAASEQQILADVSAMLQDLADKGVITA